MLEILHKELPEVNQRYISSPSLIQVVQGHLAPEMWRCKPEILVAMHPDVREFIESLRIPSYGSMPEAPNFLLEGLGDAWKDEQRKTRSKDIFRPGFHTMLVNTAGSGKTRTLLEKLSNDWGFYFICRDPSYDGIGSTDLIMALQTLQANHDFKQEFRPSGVLNNSETIEMGRNQGIARHLFYSVLLARLLVFHQFLILMQEDLESSPKRGDEEHYRLYAKRWLDLQLHPSLIGTESQDVFAALAKAIENVTTEQRIVEVFKSVIEQIQSIIKPLNRGNGNIYVVIDEAQDGVNGASSFPNAFSSSDRTERRPVLREILNVWGPQLAEKFRPLRPPSFTFVISGTGLSVHALEEALVSSAMKRHKFSDYKAIGSFETPEDQLAYIRRYVPGSILATDVGELLVHRMWFWLQGRYRFTAAFLSLLLENGYSEPNQLLNDYVQAFCGSYPTDCPLSILDSECEVRPHNDAWPFRPAIFRPRCDYRLPDWKKLADDQDSLELATSIAFKYCMGSVGLVKECFGDDELRLLQYGIARVHHSQNDGSDEVAKSARKPLKRKRPDTTEPTSQKNSPPSAVDERLVLAACATWINNDPDRVLYKYGPRMSSLYRWLSKRMTGSARGRQFFEDYVLFYFLLAFGTASQEDPEPTYIVGDILDFFEPKNNSMIEKIDVLKSRRARMVSVYSPSHYQKWQVPPYTYGSVRVSENGLFLETPGAIGLDASGKDGRKKVHQWLGGQRTELCCFPDGMMGPQLLFALELQGRQDESTSYIWVAVQVKLADEKTLPTAVLTDAIRKITPSTYCINKKYLDSNLTLETMTEKILEDRQSQLEQNVEILKLLDTLPLRELECAGAHSLIRVIASAPAAVNFESATESPYLQDGHPIACLNFERLKELTGHIPPTNLLRNREKLGGGSRGGSMQPPVVRIADQDLDNSRMAIDSEDVAMGDVGRVD